MRGYIMINLKDISTEELLKELELRGYTVTKPKTKKTNMINIENLINPVVYYREHNEQGLRSKLNEYSLEELIKITKTYTPDLNRTMYRCKNKEKVIEYIITRSSKLSVLGGVFKTLDNEKRY